MRLGTAVIVTTGHRYGGCSGLAKGSGFGGPARFWRTLQSNLGMNPPRPKELFIRSYNCGSGQ